MGRPCVPVDGDVAVQEEQTASRSEVCSVNKVNTPSGEFIRGRNTLSLSETPSAVDAIPTARPSSGDTEQQNTEHRTLDHNDSRAMCSKIISKKRKIWSGINKKYGITIATLNIKGRNRDNRESKWPMIATMMRKHRILILALQETHLDEDETEIIRQMCPKKITEYQKIKKE